MLLLLTLLMAPIYLVCVTAMPVPVTPANHRCDIQDAIALCEAPFEVSPISYPDLHWPKTKPKPKSKHTSRGSKKQTVSTPTAHIGSAYDIAPVGGLQCAVM
jgi:hypothetical protein